MGGITSITLRYIGANTVAVNALDNNQIFFNKTLHSGELFTLNGTRPNGKFSGNSVEIRINGSLNIDLDVNCTLVVNANVIAGNFLVVAAKSKEGGSLCCINNPADVTPPSISNCPANIIINADAGQCNKNVNWTAPTSGDCDLLSLLPSRLPGSSFPIGTTQVTYTATDYSGNKSTCSFNVTVKDVTPPVFSNCIADVTVNAGAACSATVTWAAPSASDACSAVTLTRSHAPGASFPVGTTRVTYTATDASNNSATCSFNVVVRDVTPPVNVACPADVSVTALDNCQAIGNWATPSFTDNCGAVTISSSHSPGTSFPIGRTEITTTATDNSGNNTVCRFFVNVLAPPVTFSNCPQDLTLFADNAGSAQGKWAEPSLSLSCATVSASHRPGDLFPLGETPVIYTASVGTATVATCSFKVIVTEEEKVIDIPNIITPDGDGINDNWELVNVGKFKNRVLIVDRWGSRIFERSGYNNIDVVWKGENLSGNTVPTGTYFYTITLESNNSRIIRKGFVEVIR